MSTESAELREFRAQVHNWLKSNRPPKPSFPLP